VGGPLQRRHENLVSAASPNTCAAECQKTFLPAKGLSVALQERTVSPSLRDVRSPAILGHMTSLTDDPNPKALHQPQQ
jgi:hypothetical protein